MTPDNDAMRALKLIENELREAHSDSDMTDNYVSQIEAAFKTIRTELQRSAQVTPAHLQPDFQEMGRTILSQAKENKALKAQVDGLVEIVEAIRDTESGDSVTISAIKEAARKALQQFSAKEG